MLVFAPWGGVDRAPGGVAGLIDEKKASLRTYVK